uniref:diacylglycerol kinase family protein n=1 Tax=Klebsiella pneumoniae TaxID=573 RepID=UPI00163DB2A1
MRKKILFIFNMYAGKGKIKTKLSDILNIFTENGYEVTAYPTQFAGEAIGRIEKMESIYECVVCSGGDGT